MTGDPSQICNETQFLKHRNAEVGWKWLMAFTDKGMFPCSCFYKEGDWVGMWEQSNSGMCHSLR